MRHTAKLPELGHAPLARKASDPAVLSTRERRLPGALLISTLTLGVLAAPAPALADDIDTEASQKRRKEQMEQENRDYAAKIEEAAKAEAKKNPMSSNNSSTESQNNAGTCSVAGGDSALVGLAALGMMAGSGVALRRRRLQSLRRAAVLAVAFAATLGSAAVARADVPPPPGYVEDCTVEKLQASTGNKCESCGDAYHGDRDACTRRFAGTAMKQECQTAGASTWDEVWCDPTAQVAADPAEAPESKSTAGETPPKTGGCRCDIDPNSQDSARIGWLGLAAFAAACLGGYALRRRRSPVG